MPTRPDQVEVPFYADDLLPDLQGTLAILADFETGYEIARDHLVRWSGPMEVKGPCPGRRRAALQGQAGTSDDVP
jgi:hypothetical protein